MPNHGLGATLWPRAKVCVDESKRLSAAWGPLGVAEMPGSGGHDSPPKWVCLFLGDPQKLWGFLVVSLVPQKKGALAKRHTYMTSPISE